MNLVQRMVAENRQTVTSRELAEAAGMSHEAVGKFIKEERADLEKHGPIGKQNGSFVLNVIQAFHFIIMIELSENEEYTREDWMKIALKDSFVDVLMAQFKAIEERTGKRSPLQDELLDRALEALRAEYPDTTIIVTDKKGRRLR